MCLAIPARITHVDGTLAIVDLSGVTRQISLALTPEARATCPAGGVPTNVTRTRCLDCGRVMSRD